MIEKHNDATPNRPQGERPIDAAGILIDMPHFIRQIKSENAWQKNDRNSITVFKTPGLTIVVGGLHKDAEFPPHRSEGIMSIQVIDGLLQFITDDLTEDISPGQMIALREDNNYRAIALEETIYLLTIMDKASS